MAEHSDETKMSQFDPAFLEDRFRTVLISKRKEKRVEVPRTTVAAAPSAQNVNSLMDVLKRSLAAKQPVARMSPKKPAPRGSAIERFSQTIKRARSKNRLTSLSDAQSLNVSSYLPCPHEGFAVTCSIVLS